MLKKSFLSAFILSAILLTSCGSYKVNITQDNIPPGAIPGEFGASKQILLIEARSKGMLKGKMNKEYERDFLENYTGKFELAGREEIETNPKYKNKEIYRYVLREITKADPTRKYSSSMNGGRTEYRHNLSTIYSYFLYDRQDSKEYPAIAAGSIPRKVLTITAKALALNTKK